MDTQALEAALNRIWLAIVALAFFDCLFVLGVGVTVAWVIAQLSKDFGERQKALLLHADELYNESRAEQVVLVQTLRKIVEKLPDESSNDKSV